MKPGRPDREAHRAIYEHILGMHAEDPDSLFARLPNTKRRVPEGRRSVGSQPGK